jgi:Fe-S cluster assembly protein SufD
MSEAPSTVDRWLTDVPTAAKLCGQGFGWLEDLRKRATGDFARLGFPTTREEGWRHTHLAPIVDSSFKLAMPGTNGITASKLAEFAFGNMDGCNLVFVNGYYSPNLSTAGALPKGVRVLSLREALEAESKKVERYLARQASSQESAFVALNTAHFTDGGFVYVPAEIALKKLIHFIFVTTSEADATVAHPRNLIVAGAGSELSLVESYIGPYGGSYFSNPVTEIFAGEGSSISHYKLQRESEQAFHVSSLYVAQEENSNVSSHFISMGGNLVRNDILAAMNGAGGDLSLYGLYVTRDRQHVDNRTVIDHAKPHCSSREVFKGILDDRSSAVFTGKILVRPDAQKTDAKQTNKNLLLSRDALVNTTPQLEIFADDVKCTHGATIGRLNDEALFYLRSRGIEEEAARSLLTYAFASDVIGKVTIKPLQCQLDLVLLARLSKSEGVL